jgi:hypothetical protein
MRSGADFMAGLDAVADDAAPSASRVAPLAVSN